MLRRRFILAAVLLCGLFPIAGAYVWNRNLILDRQERERNFIAIHFLAGDALREAYPEGPHNLDDLIRSYGGTNSVLLRSFPDGLIYLPQATSFILEEPGPRRVSIFQTDRLISTDRKWPRWEASGEYARKFSEQRVPPAGYE